MLTILLLCCHFWFANDKNSVLPIDIAALLFRIYNSICNSTVFFDTYPFERWFRIHSYSLSMNCVQLSNRVNDILTIQKIRLHAAIIDMKCETWRIVEEILTCNDLENGGIQSDTSMCDYEIIKSQRLPYLLLWLWTLWAGRKRMKPINGTRNFSFGE